ncbi:MAG: hypothetical protein HY822_21575 [Acidobacteria bacterium]|nr:hypothetical protein [Acidobacteriota bacterium]
MPRRARCIVPGVAYHVTQRGVDRHDTFASDADRTTYPRLLAQNRKEAEIGVLDLGWWREEGAGSDWSEVLRGDDGDSGRQLRQCTYSGKPFGGEEFVAEISGKFGRHWKPGRPRKARGSPPGTAQAVAAGQMLLF